MYEAILWMASRQNEKESCTGDTKAKDSLGGAWPTQSSW